MAGNNHGHTPAAWTGVTIAFIGFCVASAFTVMAEPVGFWVGVAITLLGAVAGLVMRSIGMGQPEQEQGRQTEPKDRVEA
ncbi:HGxxPAAW family protein [Streptomyces sp. TRM 70361]|uniref:HGxxPAAW family protein n=1 Tax=Streptomyces sp. TRM 70361 TaxID=3116553 RepID=UPI002E7B6EE4|nr:HGxxPAAW family protein [Streptomyces sp. TRM 70361]MEE1942221.1 HGxxPAAW family protein [Streptomyces sp. TRM 70361]